jgi:hypothetical protein
MTVNWLPVEEILAGWNEVAGQWDGLAGEYACKGRRAKTVDAYCRYANRAHAARGEIVFVLCSDAVKPFGPGVVEGALARETGNLGYAVSRLAHTLRTDIPLAHPRPRSGPPPSSLRLPDTVAGVVAQHRRPSPP